MSKYDIIFSADESNKDDLVEIIKKYRFGLSGLKMAATESTASHISLMTGLSVKSLMDGKTGGYIQIAQYIKSCDVRMFIFLFNPCSMHLDEPGVGVLLKSCYIFNVPLANNKATAEFILERFLEKQLVIQWRCPEMSSIY
jgi:methylglyoxal synthase